MFYLTNFHPLSQGTDINSSCGHLKNSFENYNVSFTSVLAFQYSTFINILSLSGIYTEIILHVPIITLILTSLFVN